MASRHPVIYHKGFSLLELIITILVVSIGILGTYSVVSYTLSAIGLSSSRLTAAYLAQEGIEIVRNIRDTNWLEEDAGVSGVLWNSGLGTGNYEADYRNDGLDTCFSPCNFNSLRVLQIEGGFYRYGGTAGVNTPFKRKITIDSGPGGSLTVTVSIQWDHKGKRQRPVIVQENLYNWKQL